MGMEIRRMIATLISGLNPTKDKNGLYDLGEKIHGIGITPWYCSWDQPALVPQSDIFICHSFGVRRVMQELAKGYPVKYLAIIDGVDNWFPIQIWNWWKKFEIPSNVARADSFQRSWPLFPPSGIIGNESASYRNFKNISMDHANAPRNTFVIQTILESVKGLI